MFYIFIPIFAGLILITVLNWDMFLTIGGQYLILLVFLIPESLFSSTLDYRTKSVNPSYKASILKKNTYGVDQIIVFLAVLVSLIICFVSFYLTTV